MQAIKKQGRSSKKTISKPFAQLLSKLIVALESEENFQLRQLYELNPSEFDLVIEILKEWRIDRHYMSKSKTFAAAFYGADLKK